MALYNNIGSIEQRGLAGTDTTGTLTQLAVQAKWFATLDLGHIIPAALAGFISQVSGAMNWAFHVFGSKPRTGERVLAERMVDHIHGVALALSQSGIDPIVFPPPGDKDAPDWDALIDKVGRSAGDHYDVILLAQLLFTILFGVRITTSEDLDALDSGAAAYYNRPDKEDIPQNAVDRAVKLKQTYYPISTYNKGEWDLTYLQQIPLVAPIPDPWNVGSYYTGPLPFGGDAVNGFMIVPEGSVYENLQGGSGTAKNAGTTWLLLGGMGLLAWVLFSDSSGEPKKRKGKKKRK